VKVILDNVFSIFVHETRHHCMDLPVATSCSKQFLDFGAFKFFGLEKSNP
jgi:hypothetical protein